MSRVRVYDFFSMRRLSKLLGLVGLATAFNFNHGHFGPKSRDILYCRTRKLRATKRDLYEAFLLQEKYKP